MKRKHHAKTARRAARKLESSSLGLAHEIVTGPERRCADRNYRRTMERLDAAGAVLHGTPGNVGTYYAKP